MKIIRENEATRWGRNHKFSRLSPKIWTKMPIITYEQVQPYIERIRNGDLFSLTNNLPIAFAKTSGTTSEPKLIILTEKSIESQKKGADTWNLTLNQLHSSLLNKVLVLSGGSRERQLELLPISSYTDIVKTRQPFYVQKRMVFKKTIEFVSDFEHRLLIAAQQAFIKQPTALISVNPMTIIRLLNLTDENRTEIGRATRMGNYIGTDISFGKIKNKEKILENIFSKNPLDSVRFLGTWLGGTQNLFIKELKSRGINTPMRDLGYLATEGRFTIPLEDNSSSGVLNPFGNYYEFLATDKSEVIPLQELIPGREYNIIITSENGLYRYDMQDIVEFIGFYNSAPVISFKRKDSCFSSLIGEKLHENHVVELLRNLNQDTGILKAELNPPHYVLYLPPKDYSFSPEQADACLQKINPEYHGKRENNRLSLLEINVLNADEFKRLDLSLNPRQDHDRFKRKYIMPLK